MKRLKLFVVLSVLALFIFSYITDSLASEALIFKSSDVHNDGYPTVEAVKHMGELLENWTNGRITVKVYPGGKLGGEREALEQVQLGYIHMTRVSLGPVGVYSEGLNAFNLPYIFRDTEHMHKVVDGDIGKGLLRGLEKGDLIGLCFMDSGSRSFYNKHHPIRTPEDMKGLRFRVMDNPIFVEMVKALGAEAVKIPFTEIYSAIKSDAVDGAENNAPTVFTQKHYEVTDYYSITEHLIVPEILVFSKKIWDVLTEADKILIRKASVLCVEKERELWQKKEEADLQQLVDEDFTIIRDIDKGPFIKATQSVREKFGGKYKDLLSRISAIR
ncbi:TRAP transporter substrate-binding protein [Candidatus Omnitrophota bacterium]